MMYTIVALVYLIVAGSSPDEPQPFMSKHTFLGLEKCQEYLKSEAFAAERVQLYLLIGQEVATRAGDTPTLAITASCREDNRV